jgi:F0F1-type ATP synthase membrane subunit c/vacuolar-type H+-ATPase subunit K
MPPSEPLLLSSFCFASCSTNNQKVAIIDEKFAKRFWPNGGAIGKHLWFNPKKPMTIVGVVGVVKQYGLEIDGKIATYFPFEQHPGNEQFLAVRTSAEEVGLSSALASQIHAVDPNVVVYDIRTMQERLYDSLARQRFSSSMLGAFAVFALLLAAVGLYGVMSRLVMQSTHDIGVLVTLGAPPGNILRLVVRQGMGLVGTGIVVGLAGAAALDSRDGQPPFRSEYNRCGHFRCGTGDVSGGGVCSDSDSCMARHESRSDGGAARRIAASVVIP